MAEKAKKEPNELSLGKILVIMFMVLFFVPILILGIIYSTNDSFKLSTNKYLVQLPGPIGNYFEAFPTEKELTQQYNKIAEYLVRIDMDRAKDKLTLIQNKNKQSYNEIIKLMLKIDSNNTSELLEDIRRSSIKKDIIVSTLEEIESEKRDQILEMVNYFNKLSTLASVKDIEQSIENNKTTYKELATIFENMKDENVVNLLIYLDPEISNNILNNFSSSKKIKTIKQSLTSLQDKEANLINMASIYATESSRNLIETLGNTDTYNLNELSVIYRHIGILKASKILSKIENKSFIYDLINVINEKELLSIGKDTFTSDLTKGIKIYSEFQQNVSDLSTIYEKMEEEKVAQLIKQLIRNSTSPKIYTLGNGDVVQISDEDLALEILKSFNERKISSILSYLDNNLSTEISKKLALPTL